MSHVDGDWHTPIMATLREFDTRSRRKRSKGARVERNNKRSGRRDKVRRAKAKAQSESDSQDLPEEDVNTVRYHPNHPV